MSGPGLNQSFHQRQTQQLVLAPQMRQSLKILQVAALDLRAAIQEELQSNPTLEELPMDDISLEKAAGSGEDKSTPRDDKREQLATQLRIRLKIGFLQHLNQVIPQLQRVGQSAKWLAVLDHAGHAEKIRDAA